MTFSASTPSAASASPRSRRTRSDRAISADANPRRRHGRRTLTCSSQPRVARAARSRSGTRRCIIAPATSSPSQATCHRSRFDLGVANQRSKSSSVRSAGFQWSRKASASASQIRRWSACAGPAASRGPRADRPSGIAADRSRTMHESIPDDPVALALDRVRSRRPAHRPARRTVPAPTADRRRAPPQRHVPPSSAAAPDPGHAGARRDGPSPRRCGRRPRPGPDVGWRHRRGAPSTSARRRPAVGRTRRCAHGRTRRPSTVGSYSTPSATWASRIRSTSAG